MGAEVVRQRVGRSGTSSGEARRIASPGMIVAQHAWSHHVAGGGLPLALGDDPVFHPKAFTTMGVGPPRDIAGSKNPGVDGPEILVARHTPVEFETGFPGKLECRSHADADDHQIRCQLFTRL